MNRPCTHDYEQVPFQRQVPESQTSPTQHGWPEPPQAVQALVLGYTAVSQMKPAPQVSLAQHG